MTTDKPTPLTREQWLALETNRRRDFAEWHLTNHEGPNQMPHRKSHDHWNELYQRFLGRTFSEEPIEPVTMDWSVLPRWATHIAYNRTCTSWWWYTLEPILLDDEFDIGDEGDCGLIPPAYAPKWTGYWRESLTEVPRTL